MSTKQVGERETSTLAVVIMAAGKETRFKSRRPKVLHQVGGRPLLSHVIAAAARVVDPQHIFTIVGDQAERVRNAVADTGVQFIEQQEQRGTGHAIQCALGAISGYNDVIVLSGDMPLIRPEAIEQLGRFHQQEDAAMTILTATSAQLSPQAMNSGIYAFKTNALQTLPKISNSTDDLNLIDISAVFQKSGQRIATLQSADAAELQSVHTLAALATLDAAMRMAAAQRLMASGVTIYRPETCVIDAGVEAEPDAVIEPYVQLLGNTRIGGETTIRSYSVIENCTIGSRVMIRQSCVLADSSVADGADLGPFARLRPGSEIGEEVHIGNFVEVKKSKLHKGVKAGHLAYLGDSEIGAGTNIGAGVITCNYDGERKHKTEIGEGAFIGSDSTLVAPVAIRDGAYVGAGSCITKEVPAGALAVGRARQITKEGWVEARRQRRKTEKPS